MLTVDGLNTRTTQAHHLAGTKRVRYTTKAASCSHWRDPVSCTFWRSRALLAARLLFCADGLGRIKVAGGEFTHPAQSGSFSETG